MYIDDCRHTFPELANTVLPAYLAQLEDTRKRPWSARAFAQAGDGPATIASNLGLVSDFSGCYVLQEGTTAVYVGISRTVLGRIRQHMLGNDHFSASLAYAMTKKGHEMALGTREAAMGDADFGTAFKASQDYLRTLSVAAVPIENPLELYVFEAYAAMALKTSEWNTFRTH